MRKEKESIINGIKFKVTQLGFSDGMELLTTLGRIIGPAISDPQKAVNTAAMIGDIISRLSFADISSITDKLAKTTRIEREPGRWPVLEPEVDLAGNYDLTLRWLKFALEVNYADFFAAGGFATRRYKSGRSEPRITPPGIPWVVHRIVTSRHYRASLIEVQQQWSIDDVVDAHQALDYFARCEYVEIRAMRRLS